MKKAIIILSVVLAVQLIALAGCVFWLLADNDAQAWQDQYDLGSRYLSDGNYEEAAIAFLAAMDIDPKRPEAYIGAAEAYVGMGDSISARQILWEGARRTDDPVLLEKLEGMDLTEEELPEQSDLQAAEPEAPLVQVVDAYRDTVGSNTYCIPKIIMADDTEAPINGQIYDQMYAILEEQAYGPNGTWLSEMSYTWGQNNGVVSICIRTYIDEVDAEGSSLFNVSTRTGQELTNEAVLQAFGLTEAEYYRQIKARINTFYDETGDVYASWVDVDDLRQQSLAEENLRYSRVYVGEDGALMAKIRTYTIAGSGTHIFSFRLETNASGGNETYRPIIEAAIAANDEASGYDDGYGVLYDVDGNGTDELIMLYSALLDTHGSPFPWTVCGVYTIENGEAVPLLEEEGLVTEAGGPSSHVSVVEKNGRTYLLTTYETGETDFVRKRGGEWVMYALDGSQIKQETVVEYSITINGDTPIYSDGYASFNGIRKSYQDLEKWVESFDEKVHLEQYSDENTGMTLEELLAQLN